MSGCCMLNSVQETRAWDRERPRAMTVLLEGMLAAGGAMLAMQTSGDRGTLLPLSWWSSPQAPAAAAAVPLTAEADLSGANGAVGSLKAGYVSPQPQQDSFDRSQFLPSGLDAAQPVRAAGPGLLGLLQRAAGFVANA